MKVRWGWVAGILVIVAVASGTAVAFIVASRPAAPVGTLTSGLTTVHVRKGTLTDKVTGGGTLSGSPVPIAAGAQAAGVVTGLPSVGSVVSQGQILYRVDNQPVVLLYGSTPVYRAFGPGMTSGPDVVQLEQDLLQLGFGQVFGLVANGDFNFADEQAVRAFTKAEGLTYGDQLALGTVLFEPGPVVIAADPVTLGDSVAAGGTVVSLDMGTPLVTVDLAPAQAAGIAAGTPAVVKLSSPPEMVTAKVMTRVASTSANVKIQLTLLKPPAQLSLSSQSVFVQFDVESVREAYIVPIGALVATLGGDYALQVEKGRRRTFIPVRVGLLDNIDGLAQVSGPGLKVGEAVEAPA
ncbi:MAG TPA: hypothetical protein VMW80_12295 [Candidatus Dormibacteraeota bacterium]|nr:hypothetical protein [Candidatus Dormibacteraeota bacterium]